MTEELLKFPVPLKLINTTAYGRGVYATCDLAPGTEILVSEPFLHVVTNSSRGTLCDVCLKNSESLQKCSNCKYVYYCGKDCQRKDWCLHKNECKVLKLVQPQLFPEISRLVFRLVQKKKLKNNRREIDLLYSNQDCVTKQREEESNYIWMEVTAMLHMCGWDLMMLYANEILYKVACNKFGISDWNLRVIATGLYLLPSMFNHSCAYNCSICYDGLKLIMRTVRPVKCGDQLFVGYVDTLQPKEKRIAKLKHIHSFQCNCERCFDEDEVATGLLAAASDDVPATAVKKTMEEGDLKLEEVEKLKKLNDWKGALHLCNCLVAQYKPILSPQNFIMVRLLQEKTESLTKLEQWTEVLEPAEQLLRLYEHHLHECDTNRTLLLCNVAVIRQKVSIDGRNWEQMKLAIDDLLKARDMLHISHGAGHSLTIDVERQLKILLPVKQKVEAKRQAKSMQ